MDIPVYLFTGFMDSGKTSLITQTLQENDFGIGSRSLIIACEDGDEEYDEEALAKNKITVVGVESEEEFTEEYSKDCDEIHCQCKQERHTSGKQIGGRMYGNRKVYRRHF